MKPEDFGSLRAGRCYDRDLASKLNSTETVGPSLTKQEFKEEADINTLVKRFGLGWEIPAGLRKPQYGDFTGVTDYHSACLAIAQANESFDNLPAEVRREFRNEPARFVEFCQDEKNREQLDKWGLVEKPIEAKPPRWIVEALRSTRVGVPEGEGGPPPKDSPVTT